MANETYNKDRSIIRQNQTQHCREYLSKMGYLQSLNPYEFTIYVELMTDFCYEGLTPKITERLKKFNKLMGDRLTNDVDGIEI
jgi:hypothetical protein